MLIMAEAMQKGASSDDAIKDTIKELLNNDQWESDAQSKEPGIQSLPVKEWESDALSKEPGTQFLPKRESFHISKPAMFQAKKETIQSPRYMQPIRSDMAYKDKEKPQKVILAREKSIRTFYGCESELLAFEEDLVRRWEDGVDLTLLEMVQDILDHVGPEIKDEIMMHDESHRQDPDKLLKLLNKLYGCRKNLSERMSDFYSCRQGIHENVLTYSRRLHKMAEGVRHRQNLDDLAELEESIERDVFIQGLLDTTLKRRLKESVYREMSTTFLEVRNEAVRWTEDTDERHVTSAPARAQVSLNKSDTPTNQMNMEDMIAKITAGVAKEVRVLKEEIKEETNTLAERIGKLEDRMNSRHAAMNSRGRGYGRGRGGFRGRGRGYTYRQYREPGPDDQCYGCKEFGHFQFQCPKKAQAQGNEQPQ